MNVNAVLAEEGGLQHDAMRVLRHRPHVMAQTHWHSHIEAFLLTEGRIWTELHGQEVELEAGRIGLFWASYPHRVTRIDAPGDIYILNVPMRRFRSWHLSAAARLAVMRGEFVIANKSVPYQTELFELWLREVGTADHERQNLMFDEAHNCIRRLDQNGWSTSNGRRRSHNGGSSRIDGRIDNMIRFINSSFQNSELRVEHVAAEAGLHPNYAMAMFKEAMGLSIGNYVTHVRLSEAQQLLLTTQHKVLAVASYCGFASPSRFYAAFQSHMGTTPSNYRESALLQDSSSYNTGHIPANT